jgi:hypothetical protein
VANPQAAGSPKRPLWSIGTAEVAASYDRKGRATGEQPAATESTHPALPQVRDSLPGEQATVGNHLLGNVDPSGSSSSSQQGATNIPTVAPSNPAFVALTATNGNSGQSAAGIISYPAVLAAPDPTIPLNDQQAAQWQKLQQDFSDAVGGPNQNPNDPAYLANWKAAKELSDQMFRAKFGFTAWLKQSTAAVQQGSGQ